MSALSGDNTAIRNGLYRVDKHGACGGIIIYDGRVVRCAPYFRAKLGYWMRFAVWISE